MDNIYAYKNTKKILDKSSSGGAFIGIVNSFINLDEKWSVYGAKFDDNFNLIHDRATTIEECYEFCGSKYIQSDMGNSYDNVIFDLQNDYQVLFTGTPCQIAALNALVLQRGCQDKLLCTMDIVCHGTPPLNFWKDYVAYLEKKEQAKLVSFSFRYKKKGWKGYPILAVFDNGRRYENTFNVSNYMTLFRKDLLMRSGCFQCTLPGKFRSDLTVADFWGVEKCIPQIPIEGGVSLILAHTQKGKIIAEKMAPDALYFKQLIDNRYLQYNHNLLYATNKPKLYDAFWKDYKEHGMEYILHKYGENQIKDKWKFYLKCFIRNCGILEIGRRVLRKV